MGKDCLPESLKDKLHWDWVWPLSKIPRAWTSFCWGVPTQILGNQKEVREDARSHTAGPAPIGERGSWQVSRFPGAPWPLSWCPLYVAFTLRGGRHFRAGARWDDVDSYVTFPTVASRVYSGGDEQDTGTK